eukprot:508897-Lingulodinium_polyedra.AAC.1
MPSATSMNSLAARGAALFEVGLGERVRVGFWGAVSSWLYATQSHRGPRSRFGQFGVQGCGLQAQ